MSNTLLMYHRLIITSVGLFLSTYGLRNNNENMCKMVKDQILNDASIGNL